MKLSTFYQITPPTDSITHQIQWLSGGGYVIQSWWWGGNPSSPRWGGTFSSHDGGYPIQSWWGYQSTHRMGGYYFRYGLGGVPHPRSRLSTLARGYLPWPGGYLPWLGGTYLGQEDTPSNVGTYSQGIYPLPRVHIPPSPSTLTRGTYLGQGGYVIERRYHSQCL